MLNPVIHYVESTDSTMLEARRLAETASAGAHPELLSGTVVRAGYQTCGRGRIKERKWESAPGDSLLFTVIFSKTDLARRMSDRPFTLLPLLCGLAVAESVEQFVEKEAPDASCSDIRIKWPNDVLADGRKLCGILCEASGEWVYAGIGINLNQTDFDSELRRPACSVSMLTGGRPDESLLLDSFLQRLNTVLARNDWRAGIESRLYRIGETIMIKPGLAEEIASEPELLEGLLSGIDSSGALLLKTAFGVVSLSSGELQV